MDTTELIVIGTFLAIVLLVVGPYYFLVVRAETADQELLRQRIRTGRAATILKSGGGLLKDKGRLSVIGPLNSALGSNGAFARHLRDSIQLSGVGTTPGQIVTGAAALSIAAYAVTIYFVPVTWLAAIAAAAGAYLPYGVIRFLCGRRLNKFEEQFPEAVDLIARTLRAGHAFTTGLRVVADELPEPVAGEFKLLHDQQNYGLPITDGLKAFARRIPIIDAQFFVTAVLTQREAGGNLAEVLDNLSGVIRERFKIKRQLRVISAHGRMTGMVLAALPPALGTYLMITTPENFKILTTDPAGIRMMIIAVGLQILGAFLIFKITDVKY